MMQIKWSRNSTLDLVRLYNFAAEINPNKARQIISGLQQSASRLANAPRIGRRIEGFDSAEVRRLIVGRYELRYEIDENVIYILRLWHTRESRRL